MTAVVPISTRRDGDVLVATMHSAPCNEIGEPMLESLETLCEQVEAGDAGALVLASAQPGGFSAGADLRALYAALTSSESIEWRAAAASFIDRIHAVMDRLHQMPVTTFAAVHGVCFGGGFELALACDVIVADDSARFCFPELRLGLIPGFGGVPRLRQEVPNSVIRDLLLTGRSVSAKRAHGLGFVTHLVGQGKAPTAALSAARQAALFDRQVVEQTKRFVRPLPADELAREKKLFLSMLEAPRVLAALGDFVSRADAMPYQPRQRKVP